VNPTIVSKATSTCNSCLCGKDRWNRLRKYEKRFVPYVFFLHPGMVVGIFHFQVCLMHFQFSKAGVVMIYCSVTDKSDIKEHVQSIKRDIKCWCKFWDRIKFLMLDFTVQVGLWIVMVFWTRGWIVEQHTCLNQIGFYWTEVEVKRLCKF
jgi:hypothetical protein